jgi:hypothetical protein
MSQDQAEVKAAEATEKVDNAAKTYEKPEVKTLKQSDIVTAVNKGSKFPARGFAG